MLEEKQEIKKFSIFTSIWAIIIFIIVMLAISFYLCSVKNYSATWIIVADLVILFIFSFAQDTEIDGGGDWDMDPNP